MSLLENTKPVFIGIYEIQHLEAINDAKKEYDAAEVRFNLCKEQNRNNHSKEYENARSDLRFKEKRLYVLCTLNPLNPLNHYGNGGA